VSRLTARFERRTRAGRRRIGQNRSRGRPLARTELRSVCPIRGPMRPSRERSPNARSQPSPSAQPNAAGHVTLIRAHRQHCRGRATRSRLPRRPRRCRRTPSATALGPPVSDAGWRGYRRHSRTAPVASGRGLAGNWGPARDMRCSSGGPFAGQRRESTGGAGAVRRGSAHPLASRASGSERHPDLVFDLELAVLQQCSNARRPRVPPGVLVTSAVEDEHRSAARPRTATSE
jgi:hypothetical protein